MVIDIRLQQRVAGCMKMCETFFSGKQYLMQESLAAKTTPKCPAADGTNLR